MINWFKSFLLLLVEHRIPIINALGLFALNVSFVWLAIWQVDAPQGSPWWAHIKSLFSGGQGFVFSLGLVLIFIADYLTGNLKRELGESKKEKEIFRINLDDAMADEYKTRIKFEDALIKIMESKTRSIAKDLKLGSQERISVYSFTESKDGKSFFRLIGRHSQNKAYAKHNREIIPVDHGIYWTSVATRGRSDYLQPSKQRKTKLL